MYVCMLGVGGFANSLFYRVFLGSGFLGLGLGSRAGVYLGSRV